MNLIERAMERLAAPGELHKNGYGDVEGDGPVCLLGAFMAVGQTATERIAIGATHLIREEIQRETKHELITEFNDDPATSLEDVLLVMKRAAVRLDGAS